MPKPTNAPYIAIACGGTGGHLFPGIAVGGALLREGAEVGLLVSNKEVDQVARKGAPGMSLDVLEAVGLDALHPWRFALGVLRSWRQVRRSFARRRPRAVLAMGGFTSVGPVLEARRLGIPTFVHESNSIPGRANRWLAPWVETAFIAFPEAKQWLRAQDVRDVGTPVREGIGIQSRAESCRLLGLDPEHPVLLVSGGSQGARSINESVMGALRAFREAMPHLQFLHLTGVQDAERVQTAYSREGRRASVHAFLDSMETALAAADVALSRAGASSLAELAAARLPALLVPYPVAADDHQVHNARAFADGGAAEWCPQRDLTPETLVRKVSGLLQDPRRLETMREALAQRQRPAAAGDIAACILRSAMAGSVVSGAARSERGARPGARTANDPGRDRHPRAALEFTVGQEGGI